MRCGLATLAALALLLSAPPLDARAQEDPAPEERCQGHPYDTYDFLLGAWRNTEHGPGPDGDLVLRSTGESQIHKVVDGCGLVEHRVVYEQGRERYRLLFLRAYDPDRGRWNQVLATNFPAFIDWTVEALGGDTTLFTTSRVLDGDTVRVRMFEAREGPDAFRRRFESSRDAGGTWTLDVLVDYTRVDGWTTRASERPGPRPEEEEEEEEGVRAAVQHYLDGHATGDSVHHRMVFHPESRLFWIQDGKLTTRTSDDYIAGARGRPAPDENRRHRRIAFVDVTGTAAVARVELDYPGAFITDYFTLLKLDGEWRIMNKIFHVRRRQR